MGCCYQASVPTVKSGQQNVPSFLPIGNCAASHSQVYYWLMFTQNSPHLSSLPYPKPHLSWRLSSSSSSSMKPILTAPEQGDLCHLCIFVIISVLLTHVVCIPCGLLPVISLILT